MSTYSLLCLRPLRSLGTSRYSDSMTKKVASISLKNVPEYGRTREPNAKRMPVHTAA